MSELRMTEKQFLKAALAGDGDAIKTGLEHGLAADTSDEYGNTALMMACARGRRDVAKILINAGANPNHTNKYDHGPRNWADWADNADPIRNLLG